MAVQVILPADSRSIKDSEATINLPPKWGICAQDDRLEQRSDLKSAVPQVPLGVLANFTGTFAGTGFNTIFRPNNATGGTTFEPPLNPLAGPAIPNPPNDNVLELNLTSETLAFRTPLGSVPNRGSGQQQDITLNGVPYTQIINDVSNPLTGKADAPITATSGIHFEPGLWMHLPATTTDPVVPESLTRMASIPHGTTINAQGLAPTTSFAGPPIIPTADITPIINATGKPFKFPSQTASATNTPRLPQDLTKFIATGTITDEMLTNPNVVLSKANEGKTITKTTVFQVSTTPAAPELGGGITDIAFLQGFPNTGANSLPNANATLMTATFWVNEVQHTIEVPPFKPGQPPLRIQPLSPNTGAHPPTFVVNPPHEIIVPTKITVTSIEIQYTQTINLIFAGLTWPHVACATLGQVEEQYVPLSAFEEPSSQSGSIGANETNEASL